MLHDGIVRLAMASTGGVLASVQFKVKGKRVSKDTDAEDGDEKCESQVLNTLYGYFQEFLAIMLLSQWPFVKTSKTFHVIKMLTAIGYVYIFDNRYLLVFNT